MIKYAAPDIIRMFKGVKNTLNSGGMLDKLYREAAISFKRKDMLQGARSARDAGILTPGAFRKQWASSKWQGVKENMHPSKFLDDITHPIDNVKKTVLSTFYTPSHEAGKMVLDKPLNILSKGTMSFGLPGLLAYGSLNDKTKSPTSRVGSAIGNATVPFMFRKFLPSMGAYTAVEKLFPAKKPASINRSL